MKVYNQFMGGVDKGDQLRGKYACFLFGVCITNAYILSRYNVNSQQPLPQSLKNFRLKLATAYWHVQVTEACWKAK